MATFHDTNKTLIHQSPELTTDAHKPQKQTKAISLPSEDAIAKAVIRSSQLLLDDTEGYGDLLSHISSAIRENATAWSEVDFFSTCADPEEDIKCCAGFAFLAGMVYASTSDACKVDSQASMNAELAEKIRSVALAYDDASRIYQSYSSHDEWIKPEICKKALERERRTLSDFLQTLPVFNFCGLDIEVADGLVDYILSAPVKEAANA